MRTKRLHRFFSAIALIALVTSPFAQAASAQWQAKMQSLSKTFSALLPDLVGDKPPTPEQTKRIKEGAKKLAGLAHAVKSDAMAKEGALPPDADPTLRFVSNLFEREVKTANRALEYGEITYAKRTLRSVASYCIACHTRHDQGPGFPTFQVDSKTSQLSMMEKAQLLAATRQFDGVLEQLQTIVGDPAAASKRQFEWGRAVREAFTIAVRVKKDPAKALQVVEKIQALPEIPPLFKDMIPTWKRSIEEWKAEPTRQLETEDALFEEANRLYQAARGTQKYWHDRSGDILYLRFSLAAHELLSRFPEGKRTGDALLLAGTAYELLDDWLVSPLPELYFEACVRKVPHTEIAHQCYLRLEEGIYFGYTGSSGTDIPGEVRQTLRELMKLAAPKR